MLIFFISAKGHFMSSLIDGMLGQLQGAHVNQIAQQLDVDPATAQNAMASALPLIVGMLGHHAQQPGGAGALLKSLQQGQAGQDDSMGGLGGMLGGVLGSLGGGPQGQGGGGGLGGLLGSMLGGGAPSSGAGGMLGQIFGGAQSHAQDGLGQATGLGAEKAGRLLQMLAPLVLSYITQHAQTNNLDAGGLGAILGKAQGNVQNQGGMAGDLLSAVLGKL